MASMNKATLAFNKVKRHFQNPCLKDSLQSAQHLAGNFDDYLKKNYGIKIVNYEAINNKSENHISKTPNLFLIKANNQYRPMNIKDVSVIENIYRKYFQASGEMDMRIFLLLDSKFGTRFISKNTGINPGIISNLRYDIRHDNENIDKIKPKIKMNLENFYLNSNLATHIKNLKLNFDV